MNIRKAVVIQILCDLQDRQRLAQQKLWKNTYEFKRLAGEQKELKQTIKVLGNLISEIQGKVKKEMS